MSDASPAAPDDPLDRLAARWRADAELLRTYGVERLAAACERHAEALEAARAEADLEALSVAEAAAVSGYSESRLYSLISEGRIPNVGRLGAPRIRRQDLPRKPGRRPFDESGDGPPSIADLALRDR